MFAVVTMITEPEVHVWFRNSPNIFVFLECIVWINDICVLLRFIKQIKLILYYVSLHAE